MTKNLSGLKVLLVHDATATNCAISLTIAAGHFHDPEDCPGLAHLLEHCLFSGCKAYPEENQINHYIESNGGQINAWTTAEMSGFNIDCQPRDFALCNHMLASMIAEPLFPTSSIDKEIAAIDAEFQSKRHEDQRRIQQVDKETCNPAHPYHHFSTGNRVCYETFSTNELAEKLAQFHNRYHHVNNMCLCLVSSLDLDQIEEKIIPFYNILSQDSEKPAPLLAPLYLPQQLGKYIEIQSIKNVQTLMVSFSLPDIHPGFESKPESLISAMLGDETAGSLLRWFQQNHWATHISAGAGVQGSNFKEYTLNIQLTNKGLSHINDILISVFSYLKLMHDEGFPNWRFLEMKQLNQLAFDYQEFPKPGKLASYLATQMHYYPDELVAYGEYLITKPDSELAKSLLQYFRPNNMRVKLVHPKVKANQNAKWYHTPYCVQDLPKALVEQLEKPMAIPALSLPRANPFTPTDLTVHSPDLRYHQPQRISQQTNGEFWLGQDPTFLQPKNELFISLGNASLNDSPLASACTRIWTSATQAYINDNFYAASVAGVYSHIYPHKRGVTLHVAGFSQHHITITQQVINALLNPDIIGPYFEQAKTQRLRALKNSLLNKPINRLFATLNNLMHEHSFLPEELSHVVEYASLLQVESVSDLLTKSYWQALAYGNWTESAAFEMAHYLKATFAHQGAKNYENKVLRLSTLSHNVVVLDCQQSEAALVYYLQGGANTLRDKAICIAIEHLLAPDYFQLMRYEKQYGYQLGCGYLPFMKAPGMALYIQSPVAAADVLLADTEAFLQHMPHKIRNLSNEVWTRLIHTLQKQLSANDQNLSIKCQRLWAALDNENQDFDESEQLKTTFMEISQQEIADYLSNLMNSPYGKLSLLSPGDKIMTLSCSQNALMDVAGFRTKAKKYI